jgi:hypothetical protein
MGKQFDEMGKQFDELAKALANGTSRRVALKRFAVGLAGAALANTFLGRVVQAQDLSTDQVSQCNEVCLDAQLKGRDYGECVATCATCLGQGGQIFEINNGDLVCV